MSPSPRALMSLFMIMSTVMTLGLIVLTWVMMRLHRQTTAALAKTREEIRAHQHQIQETVGRLASITPLEGANPRSHPTPPLPRTNSASQFRVDVAVPNAVTGPTLIAVPSLAATSMPSTPTLTHDLGRRFGPIWELADSGASADMIARKTGQPIGQVELILALRRQLATTNLTHRGEPHPE